MMIQPIDFASIHRDSILRNLVPSGSLSNDPLVLKKEWEQAILQYDGSGGAVEMVFMRPVGGSSPATDHQNAALTTMTLIAARRAYYDETVAKLEHRQSGSTASTLLDGEGLQGTEITIEAFLGSGYDLSKRSFAMPPHSAKPGKVADIANLPEGERGLVYAACTAPHGVTNHEQHFKWLLAEVFDWFAQPTEVYQWNTDCSSYFDAGKEWWGSFFWTVHVKSKNLFVGLVASTTD